MTQRRTTSGSEALLSTAVEVFADRPEQNLETDDAAGSVSHAEQARLSTLTALSALSLDDQQPCMSGAADSSMEHRSVSAMLLWPPTAAQTEGET
jgi:hypothetical protein